jgi:putative flippase GtrA
MLHWLWLSSSAAHCDFLRPDLNMPRSIGTAAGFSPLANQFLLFATVGTIATAGQYLTLILLVQFGHLAPMLASTLGFSLGAVITYILNYKFTFRSRAKHRNSLARFLIVAPVGASINVAIMWFGVEVLQLTYIVAQLLATGFVMIFNFTLSRIWTFNEASC